jgi:S-adenosyl methyltransferase
MVRGCLMGDGRVRAFLVRAVRYLAGEAGIRQFLDVPGHIADDDQAQSIVRRLVGGVRSGSYLTMNDGTDTSEEVVEAARIWNQSANPTYHLRSPEGCSTSARPAACGPRPRRGPCPRPRPWRSRRAGEAGGRPAS